MSAIYGIVDNAGSLVERAEFEKLQQWNLAYGRDGRDIWNEDGIELGCCYERLSSAKPCSTYVQKDGRFVAVWDALLYNRTELGREYGVQTEQSDEELLHRCYQRGGAEALASVNGDFCGAVYDGQRHTLTLIRDHMGVRPLFYYADEHRVSFSTDIRGLLALEWVDASINEDWLYRTCAGYIPYGVTETEYAHIHCVRPASCLTFTLDDKITAQETVYWQLGSRRVRLSSFDEYKRQLRELITDAVNRRLEAVTGPFGAELSGGLDSSVIDILIHRAGRECCYHSWSYTPDDVAYAQGDERYIIEDICRQEGIECHYSRIENKPLLDSLMAQTMLALGLQPVTGGSKGVFYCLPQYANTINISETCEYMKSQSVKVVFTGHGGDEGVSHRCDEYELFYHHEYLHYAQRIWDSTQGEHLRLLRTLRRFYKKSRQEKAYFDEPCCFYDDVAGLLKADFSQQYAQKPVPMFHFFNAPELYIRNGGSRGRLDNIALQGAYNGIRYVVPYLDYRVVDYAVSVPRYLYLHGTTNRYLFREAFKDMVPQSLYELDTKQTASLQNYPHSSDEAQRAYDTKMEIYQLLNREEWRKYLDFEKLDSWMQEDIVKENSMPSAMGCLYKCAMAQNVINQVRKK